MHHSSTIAQATEQNLAAAHKSYRLECRTTSEYDHAPGAAIFLIDVGTAKLITELAGLVKAHGLHTVEKFDYRVTYLKHDPETDSEMAEAAGEDNDLRTVGDCLVVSDTEFWFSANAKHSDVLFTCVPQRIQDLVEHFDLKPESSCASCGEDSNEVIGCPSGDEICRACFANGKG
ncbi:hypothetical protein IPC1147_33960 [Pseudomonas aeruginosa]|uniref:hypothetical protein n=1 Tax=Pseudomonas aeruginosa TaxID=287 RepID=UPI000F53F6D7|nr:hypothetical protein [Pseudomonas aeruginosa]MBA5106157.1 hypothetical protein [Pseudomonas aeruginosa]MBD1300185.1 hypothetical protein [Pseudomonas aeruginosa]MBD1340832.1 hypothetical protein [Pseudomonas aeruginosa]MBG4604240.1 hypothetical protein [Pseudomonas aeruginosa]MBH3592925.1 hypothetical protein [Pseudomonas aeruginosa]